MAKTILHIDMDAFFAAIEVLDDPSLAGKPVIVGGTTKRGVVSTANYEARRFGVHSAMPIFMAKKKCPHGTFLPVRKERYAEISRKILDILKDFTPSIEQVSIDEAYLDITGTEELFGSPEQIVRRIKDRIRKETGLTCSIGVAPNKVLAKIGSDMNKPDGLTIILANDVEEFLSRLPVEKIPGVGKRSLDRLQRYGIKMVGDLGRFSEERLLKEFGKFGHRLYEIAKGADASSVVAHAEAKSISSEETLPSDTGDLSVLRKWVMSHGDRVAQRLRKEGLKGGTITIKIKFNDFSAITKSHTLAEATDISKTISETAVKLLLDQALRAKVRLIGVAVSNLEKSAEDAQLGLFEEEHNKVKERNVDQAMDKIREKFGTKVITRGED
ncbi:MAG: DNA polymerase IV [Proteobacteria bacterium]|nr:DNA polymerase IV [Pseudomonadota bacterium]